MWVQAGVPINFYFQLMEDSAGRDDVVDGDITVWRDIATTVVLGETATALGDGGLYYYTLDADDNDQAGDYLALLHTEDADVNAQDVPALRISVGSLDLSEGSGDGLTNTLGGLRAMLRILLNDVLEDGNTAGAYRKADLDLFINLAYRETVGLALSHKVVQSLTLIEGQAEYDVNTLEICRVADIILKTSAEPLTKVGLADQGVLLPAWQADASGTPTEWMPVTGSTIIIHPAPDAASALIDAYIVGWGYPDELTLDADIPTAIPEGYSVQSILYRAECLARRARPSVVDNLNQATRLEDNWRIIVREIAKAVNSEMV